MTLTPTPTPVEQLCPCTDCPTCRGGALVRCLDCGGVGIDPLDVHTSCPTCRGLGAVDCPDCDGSAWCAEHHGDAATPVTGGAP